MDSIVKRVFDQTSAGYDHERSRLIPGCEDFYRWAVHLIPGDARRIIDLGAGTGMLSAQVLARFPGATVHLIDLSEAMLDQAHERLRGTHRASFEVADYGTADLPGGMDAVISALSIHHLEHDDKRRLFARVADSLKPGGVFINADQVLGPTPGLEERYKAEWLDEVRRLGASGKQVEDSLFRQHADRCASVDEQTGWMRESFSEVDCWYKNGRFAVMSGVKR